LDIYEKVVKSKGFFYEHDMDALMSNNKDYLMFTNINFDKTRIKSLSEKPVFSSNDIDGSLSVLEDRSCFKVKQILPLISIDGLLYITNKRVYFQPYQSIYQKPVINWDTAEITSLFRRRYKLINTGMEFLCKQGKGLFLAFKIRQDRETVYRTLKGLVGENCETENSIRDLCYAWVNGAMSNYDYLMKLNSMAFRSF
jgi:hypothetical protein